MARQGASTAREAALKALVRVEQDNAYLNLALPPLLEPLSARERSLAVKIASGSIQHLNTLDWALSFHLKRKADALTPWMRNLLRSGAYQLLYLERIPASAVVDQSVRLARRYGHCGVAGLVNAVLRSLSRSAADLPWPDPDQNFLEHLVIRHSHPRWMVERWLKRYGRQETEELCRANNLEPPLSIRPNMLRTDPEKLQARLAAEGVPVSPSPLLPGALRAGRSGPLSKLPSFQEGLFTVQGESSMLVAPTLEPLPGETLLDLCSAPGGKTTHLAELIKDCGKIFAVDLHPVRLKMVEKAARRLGLHSIETRPGDGTKAVSLGLPAPGRILVDAPCSGLGVIRRLPDLKWRRRPEDLTVFKRQQLALLNAAADCLAPGGLLLYSVCSNEQEETTGVVQEFSSGRRDLVTRELAGLPCQSGGTASLYPHRHGLDGFFMAAWRRA